MNFNSGSISGSIVISHDIKSCIIRGTINESVHKKQIGYTAAAPPHLNGSFSGSALPYPNQTVAFDNTPIRGIVQLDKNNTFEICCEIPSAYYVNLGSVLVPPQIYITYNNYFINKKEAVTIMNEIPYRTLTYHRSHKNVQFYDNIWKLPVRDQEQILRDSAYPSCDLSTTGNRISTATEFWKLKPSL
jgi:hypothetical protein